MTRIRISQQNVTFEPNCPGCDRVRRDDHSDSIIDSSEHNITSKLLRIFKSKKWSRQKTTTNRNNEIVFEKPLSFPKVKLRKTNPKVRSVIETGSEDNPLTKRTEVNNINKTPLKISKSLPVRKPTIVWEEIQEFQKLIPVNDEARETEEEAGVTVATQTDISWTRSGLEHRRLVRTSLTNRRLDLKSLTNEKPDVKSLTNQKPDIKKLTNQKIDLKTLTNQKLDLKTLTNQKLDLKSLTNQNPNLRSMTNEKSYLRSLTNQKQDLRSLTNQNQDLRSLTNQKLNLKTRTSQRLDVRSLTDQKQDLKYLANQNQDLKSLTNEKPDPKSLPNQKPDLRTMTNEVMRLSATQQHKIGFLDMSKSDDDECNLRSPTNQKLNLKTLTNQKLRSLFNQKLDMSKSDDDECNLEVFKTFCGDSSPSDSSQPSLMSTSSRSRDVDGISSVIR